MLSTKKIIKDTHPLFFQKHPSIANSSLQFLRFFFKESRINEFLRKNRGVDGFEFIDAVLEELGVDFLASSKDLARIPTSGRLVIVANHPLGGVDALVILRLISLVRKDIKILATPVLKLFKPLEDLFILTDNIKHKNIKQTVLEAATFLSQEGAVIIFPAAEVSRMGLKGIKDAKWTNGFLKLAKRTNSPILPLRIHARNSGVFYGASFVSKPLSTMFLVRELFKQKNKALRVFVGHTIELDALENMSAPTITKLMYKQVFALGKSSKQFFRSSIAIAPAQDLRDLKKCLKDARLLGQTSDNKKIYLAKWQKGSSLMKELGRLREFSFRKVGEGSGKHRDNDKYDKNYEHIVLWDDEGLEIVGSYRIKQVSQNSQHKIYTQELFDYSNAKNDFFSNAIELGRSFVVPKFWGSRSLDYLWQGIGAYLRQNPQITTLFGAVSISASYNLRARQMLVYFYGRFFGGEDLGIRAKNPFEISKEVKDEFDDIFDTKELKDNFLILKSQMSAMGYSVPTLYKQYTNLCEYGGVKFSAFGVDDDFKSCVDGLIFVDLTKMLPIKKRRYINLG